MSAPDDIVKLESAAESDSELSLGRGHAEAKNHDPHPTDACRATPRTRKVFFSRSVGRDKSPPSSCDPLHDYKQDSVTNQGRETPPTTHATVLQRFQGWSIRSGTRAQPLTPPLVNFTENSSKKKKGAGESDLKTSHRMKHRDDSIGSSSSNTVQACNETTPNSQESQSQVNIISSKLDNKSKDNGHSERHKGDGEEIEEGEEGIESPRSLWAASLMAATQARAQSTGRGSLGNCRNILPSPPRDPNKKVDYLILVCKAAKKYAWSQVGKLVKVRDGRHLFNQLLEVTSDLDRQRDKILAVYDTREVKNSADRLGETLKAVYELLGDLEDTSFMFGKKKGFGKRVSALVHDIGTNSNALLVATSLAIVDSLVAVLDRPNVLCTEETGTDKPQQEELVKMCIEGDKVILQILTDSWATYHKMRGSRQCRCRRRFLCSHERRVDLNQSDERGRYSRPAALLSIGQSSGETTSKSNKLGETIELPYPALATIPTGRKKVEGRDLGSSPSKLATDPVDMAQNEDFHMFFYLCSRVVQLLLPLPPMYNAEG